MLRTCSLALLTLAALLGGTSSSRAAFLHRGSRVVFGPVLPCGRGFHCRFPLSARCIRFAPPTVVVASPVVVVPPAPAAVRAPTLLPPPGPIVSVLSPAPVAGAPAIPALVPAP